MAEDAPKRILVIEDDPSISWGLQMNLEKEGFVVQVAEDGESGLELAESSQPDLLILDVMLPKLNGLEVLRALRASGSTVPIVVLSARGAEMDKVMGLELGAEDYITKPFGLAELLARVKAALRRSGMTHGAGNGTVIRARDLEIRRDTRQVIRNGQPIVLTATEFDVLWCLIRAGGKVLSRDEIRAAVWGPTHRGTPRTIDNFLLQLRNKLESDPQEPEHLLTVRGVGYRFRR